MKTSRQTAPIFALLTSLLAAPATHAATTAPAADYSDPRKAVASFLRAKDEAGLREALIIEPATAATIESFLGVMIATTNLQTAAEKKFPGNARQFTKASDDQIAARIKSLDTADLAITAASATITLPPDTANRQSGGTIVLKQAGGVWKIDAASLFGVGTATAEETAKRVKLADTLTVITKQMIRDIEAGKFISAGEAFQEYWTRSKDAVSRPTATAPAGAPETSPATKSN